MIAKALFSNPEILILDEPCTGLDIYNRSYLFNTIEALARYHQVTMIYVTHYVEEVLPVFEKTVLMKNGTVFAQGDTAEMFSNETMQRFLNYPVSIEKTHDGQYQAKLNIETSIPQWLELGEETWLKN